LRQIFDFFVSNWRFSFVIKFLLLAAGIVSLSLLPKESYPPVNFATLTITTIYPGASPEEIEEKITNEIESELRGIEGLEEVTSISQPDRSEIVVRIDIDSGSTESIVNEIQRAVQRASAALPSDLPEAPIVREIKAKEIPVIEFALTGPSEGRQRDALAYRLKKDFEDVTGVSSARLAGYRAREFHVLVNQARMRATDVGLPEVAEAIASRARNVPTGYLRTDTRTQMVRIMAPVTDARSLGEIPIRSSDGFYSVRVKDIGRAVEGSEDPSVLARFNGEPATLLTIAKKSDSDTLSVVRAVREKKLQIEKDLPPGYALNVYNDEGLRVENRLEIVNNNAVSGLIIVVLILFAFLPGRVGLISALSLPLSICGTVWLMIAWGAAFNLVTMLALIICLGNLVDNSVVMAEHYSHLREQGMPGREAAVESAMQFWIPFTASTLTIIAAFLPMLVTRGVMGQFIRWIPIVVTAALTISLLEALFLLPARLQMISPRQKKQSAESQGWFDRFQKQFERLIEWAIHHRLKTFSILSGLILSGFLVTALFNRFELFPAEGVEYYVARYEAPIRTSIYETDRLGAALARDVIRAIGEKNIRGIVGQSGYQSAGFGDPQTKSGEHVGVLLIAIQPEVAPSLDIQKTLTALRGLPKPQGLTSLTFESEQNGPPIGKPLTLTLRSPDYAQLRELTDILKARAAETPGVFNAADDEQKSGPEITVVLDSISASAAGLSTGAVGQNVRTALQGLTVGKLTREEEEVEIVVKLAESDKDSVQDVRQMSVMNPQGRLVQVSRIAGLREQEGPSHRKHYNFRRAVTITAEIDPEKITSARLNYDIRSYYESIRSRFPAVTVKFGGEEENTQESLQSLGLALMLAVFGIFATLVFTFKSFSRPMLILSSIPLGLIGVCYAFVLDQRPLSFMAFIGVVGLSGVVINSAIILVDYIEELKRDLGATHTMEQILVIASGRRLRAVLATGLTTVVGLLPAAFSLGGYDPLLVPMTLALSWGMIVGTVTALIWIPVSYLILDSIRIRIRRLLGRPA
jgi:multidrug efflux pump subunit AcrB